MLRVVEAVQELSAVLDRLQDGQTLVLLDQVGQETQLHLLQLLKQPMHR